MYGHGPGRTMLEVKNLSYIAKGAFSLTHAHTLMQHTAPLYLFSILLFFTLNASQVLLAETLYEFTRCI
jgi:hypothetical protein